MKITDNTQSVINDIRVKSSVFIRMAAEDIKKEALPHTPKRDGRLNRDILIQVLGLHGVIAWVKAYASYQEAGKRRDGSRPVRNYTTPGTSAHFAENAVKKVVQDTPIIARRVF